MRLSEKLIPMYLGAFYQVLAINPDEKTAVLYLERVNYLIEKGLRENWSGIWTLTQK